MNSIHQGTQPRSGPDDRSGISLKEIGKDEPGPDPNLTSDITLTDKDLQGFSTDKTVTKHKPSATNEPTPRVTEEDSTASIKLATHDVSENDNFSTDHEQYPGLYPGPEPKSTKIIDTPTASSIRRTATTSETLKSMNEAKTKSNQSGERHELLPRITRGTEPAPPTTTTRETVRISTTTPTNLEEDHEPGSKPIMMMITGISLMTPPSMTTATVPYSPEIAVYKRRPGAKYECYPSITEGGKQAPKITIHEVIVQNKVNMSTMTVSNAAMRIIDKLTKTVYPEATLQANPHQIQPKTLDYSSTTTKSGTTKIMIFAPAMIAPDG